jgi:hypothetical protein
MTKHEKALDRLFDAPILKPPVDFLDKVMRQVEDVPSAQFLRQGLVNQHVTAKKKRQVVTLNMTKLAAFVFGIMLATAAV